FQKDVLPPNDWRRISYPRNGRLPEHAVIFRPMNRHTLVRGNPGPIRPTEAWPRLRKARPGADQAAAKCKQAPRRQETIPFHESASFKKTSGAAYEDCFIESLSRREIHH